MSTKFNDIFLQELKKHDSSIEDYTEWKEGCLSNDEFSMQLGNLILNPDSTFSIGDEETEMEYKKAFIFSLELENLYKKSSSVNVLNDYKVIKEVLSRESLRF